MKMDAIMKYWNFILTSFLTEHFPVVSWMSNYNLSYLVADVIAGFTVGLTVVPQGIAYAAIANLPPQYGMYSALTCGVVYCIFGKTKEITVGPTAIMALMTAQLFSHSSSSDTNIDITTSYVSMIVLLTFLTGIFIALFGIFKLGPIVEFISTPVISGFTSAAAITIASSQIRHIFGITVSSRIDSKTNTFIAEWFSHGVIITWFEAVTNFHTLRWTDTVMGLTCCVFLLMLRFLGKPSSGGDAPVPVISTSSKDDDTSTVVANHVVDLADDEKDERKSAVFMKFFTTTSTGRKKCYAKLCYLISIGRNATIVILCASIAYACNPDFLKPYPVIHKHPAILSKPSIVIINNETDIRIPENTFSRNNTVFKLTGPVQGGLPDVKLPDFSYTNKTSNEVISFYSRLSYIGSRVIVVPLISVLESVAIAKSFAHGKPIDASQEMIALGMCNIVGSFFSSMPVAGSFSRTAVNSATGVRSPMGGIVTSVLVLIALLFFMPVCAFIPKTSLAAVIIMAVVNSIETSILGKMWRIKKSDFICAIITFLTCLILALEMGILLGTSIQIIVLLFEIATPRIKVEDRKVMKADGKSSISYVLIKMDKAIHFPSTSHIIQMINKRVTEHLETMEKVLENETESHKVNTPTHTVTLIVLDMKHVVDIDFTSLSAVNTIIKNLYKIQEGNDTGAGERSETVEPQHKVKVILTNVDSEVNRLITDIMSVEVQMVATYTELRNLLVEKY